MKCRPHHDTVFIWLWKLPWSWVCRFYCETLHIMLSTDCGSFSFYAAWCQLNVWSWISDLWSDSHESNTKQDKCFIIVNKRDLIKISHKSKVENNDSDTDPLTRKSRFAMPSMNIMHLPSYFKYEFTVHWVLLL